MSESQSETTTTQEEATTQTGGAGETTESQEQGFTDANGNFVDGWTGRFGDEYADYRNDPTLPRYKSLQELSRAHIELRKAMGARADETVVPRDPGPDASEEQRKGFEKALTKYRKAIGVPDAPDGYKLKPEQLPEGVTWNDEIEKRFAQVAHKHNIPPAAMVELVKLDVERAFAQSQSVATEIEQGILALQDEWKGNYKKNMGLARNAVAKIAGQLGMDPEEALNSSAFRDPNFVRIAAYMGQELGEDHAEEGQPGGDAGMTGEAFRHAMLTGVAHPQKYDALVQARLQGDADAAREVRKIIARGY